MIVELSFKEIEFLIQNKKKVHIESAQGFTEIKQVFTKEELGTIIQLDDKTEIKCAITHNLLVNSDWKTPNMLSPGDYLTDKFGQKSKQITKITRIPKQKWIDFEVDNEFESYVQNDVMHHNSGKSLIAFLFFRYMLHIGKSSLLVVPSINLVDQMFSDFEDYGFTDAGKFIKQIGGDHKGTKDLAEKPLVISTWQSLQRMSREDFDVFDALVIDEAHSAKSEVLNRIINNAVNAKWKLGMTGTIPRVKVDKLTLLGTLGKVHQVINPQGLIDRGLATPIQINALYMNYSTNDRDIINKSKKPDYNKEVQFIEEHYYRNLKVAQIMNRLADTGNVLGTFSHIAHGEKLLRMLIAERTNEMDVELLHKLTPKPIKEAYELYKENLEKGVLSSFYMNSPVSEEDRKKARKILKKEYPEENYEKFINQIKSLDEINIFLITGAVSGADREYIRHNLETVHPNIIEVEFGDIKLELNKSATVLLEDGTRIQASELTEDSDVSEKWINEQQRNQEV